MIRFNKKTTVPVFVLLAVLLLVPAEPAFAFWGLLGRIGGAAGKAGGSVAGKAAAGTAAKGAAAGVGAEGVAAAGKGVATGAGAEGVAGGNLIEDAARGSKFGAAEVMTANAALPPEVAHYLSKPVAKLTTADTVDMMTLYRQMINDAGKSGDFTVVERLPNTANQGKTLSNSGGAANGAALEVRPLATIASNSNGVPAEAIQLLLHAGQAGNHAARVELDRRCAAFSKPATTPKAWQEACKKAA